ncbi:hypothetical protein BASA81_013479 [Batrachochytrium salamandrivorans]|nr:hypothetical protein BASA81_013479 [Batrachochytrium salamandrivorans]
MLSANVFAIEHPNDAYSGSLLARRAVMADADDVFLQKRSDDKDQEEQTKPKTYIPIPNSGQKGYVYREDLSENDFDSDSSSSDGAEGSSTDFPDYDPEQDDEDQGARNNVYSGLDSGQRRPSFADALGGSPSQVFDHIKNGLSRAKQGAKLFSSRQRALDASDKVRLHFGGIEGKLIGEEVYAMLRCAAKTSQGYQGLYNDPGTSPFGLTLPSVISYNLKEQYESLQKDVKKSIKAHITAINDAAGYISAEPTYVVEWLESMMETLDNFYQVVLDAKSKYRRLAELLGMSDTRRLEDLKMHIKAVGAYQNNISEYFDTIKKMVEDYRKSSKEEGPLNAFAPRAGF